MPLSWVAHTISLFRIALIIPYGWLFFAHAERKWLFILALVIIASDKLDGTLARKFKIASKLGALLDSIADSLFVLFSWFLFYFQGFYNFTFLIILMLPRFLMGASVLFYSLQKQEWNLEHTLGNKLGAVVNFIAILWLLSELPYGKDILWVMIVINYLALGFSLIQRYKKLPS